MIDWHVHSTFSDGQLSVPEILDLALERGISSIAITDHWDPFDPSLDNRGLGDDRLCRHLSLIRKEGGKRPLEVFAGIETATASDGLLRLNPSLVRLCDLVITSPHYVQYAGPVVAGQYFNDGYWEAYKRLVLAQARGEGHILGHPEGYLPLGPLLVEGTTFEERQDLRTAISERYLDKAYYEELAAALCASGKACELHAASATPRPWVVELLAHRGVCFSVGSDAHTAQALGRNQAMLDLVQRFGLKLFTPRKAMV